MVIELDLSVPWDPPEPVVPPRRRGRRWVAAVVVGLVSAAVLAGGAARVGMEPVYRVDDVRILDLQSSGGRILVSRYRPDAPGTLAEVRRLRDGRVLWSLPLAVGQRLAFLNERVVARMSDDGSGPVTVFDAATGNQLWERPRLSLSGRAGRLLVSEDLPDGSPQLPTYIVTDGGTLAPVQLPGLIQRRYLAIDERTGETVWTFEPPSGAVAYARDDGLWVLNPDGRLETRDLATAALIGTRQLAWSGTVSWYSMSDHEVMVVTAGKVGTDVYDVETGRLLWRWAAADDDSVPYPCTDTMYCLRDDTGLAALDPRTGERRWHLDGYNGAFADDGRTVLVTNFGFGSAPNAEQPIAAVDARTGRKLWEITGWRLTMLLEGSRVVVWREDGGGAVLAVVNLGTGRPTLFGRATAANRDLSCVQNAGMLACVADGALSVWHLP
ncbi:PQQ-binding-like beta-propeller repeat protein [Dactylosporangium sucinum]|uniref:outer membrane protein assembly factor BamB family protein n=1 Tax=Dactylosporangium sucinum TaxID=1424081 RepID=UPI00167E404B|nr:PQQ-binding-like beta-propeller repeat protein [Dactylosporangium sucinum]